MTKVSKPAAEVLEHLSHEGYRVDLFDSDNPLGGMPWCEYQPRAGVHHHLLNLNTWSAVLKRGWVEPYDEIERSDSQSAAHLFYRLSEAGKVALLSASSVTRRYRLQSRSYRDIRTDVAMLDDGRVAVHQHHDGATPPGVRFYTTEQARPILQAWQEMAQRESSMWIWEEVSDGR
jgi:hypothetical protein